MRSNAFGPYFLKFSSSRDGVQKVLYLENGTGDQSQIWSKVSSSVVLLIYRDRDFREKSHMRGFVIDGHIYTTQDALLHFIHMRLHEITSEFSWALAYQSGNG